MLDGPAHRAFNKTADKWRALAEKRRAYFLELFQSGRWELYYTEPQIMLRIREANATADAWATIIEPAVAQPPALETPVVVPWHEPVTARRRSAA
jgi:uncharacterized repeat protein (TIGR03809 family)